MAQTGLGIAAAAVGLWVLLREVKSIEVPTVAEALGLDDFLEGMQITGTGELLQERTEALQTYEAERLSDAQRIEQERARALLVGTPFSNYGTIPSGITGRWQAEPPAGADRCSALYATGSSSAATHYYTGKYCREAQAAGFISPFSGGL